MVFNLNTMNAIDSSTPLVPSITLVLDYTQYYLQIFASQSLALASSRTSAPKRPMADDLTEDERIHHVFCIDAWRHARYRIGVEEEARL